MNMIIHNTVQSGNVFTWRWSESGLSKSLGLALMMFWAKAGKLESRGWTPFLVAMEPLPADKGLVGLEPKTSSEPAVSGRPEEVTGVGRATSP